MRSRLVALVLVVGCAPAFEDTEAAQVEAPAEPTFDDDRPSPLPKTIAQATEEARRRAERPCEGGKVKGPGGCERCVDDEQCPTTCNLETARCAPVGWCEVDEHCGDYETCDEGLCIFRGASSEPCGLGPIYFAWDSATVTEAHKARMAAAVECLAKSAALYIEAHSDDVGSEEFNILLAERRGMAVRDALVEAGLPRDKLQVIAKGSLEATGTDARGRAADRRVLIISP